MNMVRQALLMILFTSAYSKSEWSKVCPTALSEVDIDRYFGGMVALTLHSLTLEDIRHYYKKDVTVDNGIPTVNYDLSPNVTRVLANAPLSGYDLRFKTMAMKHTDQVLSKMDTKDWGIRHDSIVESMVHAHHMAELWERSRPYYDNFVKSPPREKVCKCLRRIDENGVIAELELLALKIKFPGLLSGDPDLPYGKNARASTRIKFPNDRFYPGYFFEVPRWPPYLFEVTRKKDNAQEEYLNKLMQFDFGGDEEDVVDRAMKELQDGEESTIAPLVDEEGWKVWKEGMAKGDETVDRQFGMFMYCMLNK